MGVRFASILGGRAPSGSSTRPASVCRPQRFAHPARVRSPVHSSPSPNYAITLAGCRRFGGWRAGAPAPEPPAEERRMTIESPTAFDTIIPNHGPSMTPRSRQQRHERAVANTLCWAQEAAAHEAVQRRARMAPRGRAGRRSANPGLGADAGILAPAGCSTAVGAQPVVLTDLRRSNLRRCNRGPPGHRRDEPRIRGHQAKTTATTSVTRSCQPPSRSPCPSTDTCSVVARCPMRKRCGGGARRCWQAKPGARGITVSGQGFTRLVAQSARRADDRVMTGPPCAQNASGRTSFSPARSCAAVHGTAMCPSDTDIDGDVRWILRQKHLRSIL
jgi:hypothetical protein